MASSETTARFRRAAETNDIDGLISSLAPNVLLHSPISGRVDFHGTDQMPELVRSVFATIDDIRYFADIGDERTRALFYRGRVGSQPLEEALRIELDENEPIREITLFTRPLPGLTAMTAGLAPRAARKHGRLRSLVARLLFGPLGVVIRLGDRLAPWFV